MQVLAVDPGVKGAAVLLGADGCTVEQAWAWRRLGRAKCRGGRHAWDVTTTGGHIARAPTLPAVGAFVAASCPADRFVLLVEGLFGRGETLRILSESAAMVYAPLTFGAVNDLSERSAGQPEWRPRSRTWRADVLGISETQFGAAASERRAMAWVASGAVAGLGHLEGNPHACEAACMARWGWSKWMVRERAA